MSLIQPNGTDKIDSIVPDKEYLLFNEKVKELQKKGQNEWNFQVVSGFFKQSHPETDDLTYDSNADHFGLSKGSWSQLTEELKELNKNVEDPSNERYKLVFCARHGQGYHNKAVEIWGIKAWDDHYSHLKGAVTPDGEYMEWAPDPFLTEKGVMQAKYMNGLFKQEISEFGCPIPTKLYSSPFTRSAQTMAITMNNICMLNDQDADKSLLGKERLYPLVIENLRETIGEHLCDKRSERSIFEKRMNGWGFQFEDGFEDADLLYRDEWREPIHEQAIRAHTFLQTVFNEDSQHEVVYCASHSGEIKALIVATGHRQYTVPTAGMIPILIKATRRTN